MGVTCFDTKCYAMKANDYIAHFRDLFNENSTLFVFIVIINYLEHQNRVFPQISAEGVI